MSRRQPEGREAPDDPAQVRQLGVGVADAVGLRKLRQQPLPGVRDLQAPRPAVLRSQRCLQEQVIYLRMSPCSGSPSQCTHGLCPRTPALVGGNLCRKKIGSWGMRRHLGMRGIVQLQMLLKTMGV